MTWWKRVPVLSLLGGYFLCIGFVHLVGIIGIGHFGGPIPWLNIAYCLLNFTLAYGLLKKEAWVLPALALNFAAYVALFGLVLLSDSDSSLLRRLIGTLVTGGLWLAVFTQRNTLLERPWGGAGIPFLLLWTIVYVVALLRVLG